ncbi:MAG: nucleotidyltransferase domain-containing protein [Lachnospiraceae bacterium]|nr:nucleotidyltransferase domain-containing protein [Lachnospiraceae bacterium]
MAETLNYTITEIKGIVRPILDKYSAREAVLFGSFARNEAHDNSDIDIMVVGGNDFDPTDIFCIAEDLYRLSGKNVDVYEEREINKDSDFYRNILRDGVKI